MTLASIALALSACGSVSPTPSGEIPRATPVRMATPDRLAEPALSENASQQQRGAHDFWLHCLPCHGDAGQGLTLEFRQLYPEDHQNCWASGCHGKRPYDNGWTLPDRVPALVGPGVLASFQTAANLQAYLRAVMPFQAPGSLTDDTYWQITAHLLGANGVAWPDGELTSQNAASVLIHP
jgi:cytochrome c